jgi:hypothetical protein
MPTYLCAIAGAVWAQEATDVVSYDQGASTATEVYTLKVRTGAFRPGKVSTSQGRVRSVSVAGKTLASHLLRVRLLADDKQRVILNKSRTVDPLAIVRGPSSLTPEMRATQQRCAFVSVELSATPAYGAEWNSVDLWATANDERQLSRRRS